MSETDNQDDGGTPESTARTVAALAPWFHNLHLPDGTQTAPEHFLGDYPAFKWAELGAVLPQDLRGWSVLDIGCNAGFYSFEMAHLGAQVTAIDSNPHYLKQARWAAGLYGLAEQIEFRELQVYSLAREQARYDLVLFLGVLYHLRYPLLALDIVARKARRVLCVQSLSLPGSGSYPAADDYDFEERDVMLDSGWPKAAFVEKRFAGDPTVWWVPNSACIQAMLRDCGMRVTARPGPEMYVCAPDPEARRRADAEQQAEYGTATGLGAESSDRAPVPSGESLL